MRKYIQQTRLPTIQNPLKFILETQKEKEEEKETRQKEITSLLPSMPILQSNSMVLPILAVIFIS